jgi:hypothetical protein
MTETDTRQIAGLRTTLDHMGGNCTALRIALPPDGREILITDLDGNGPPEPGDDCFVGVYERLHDECSILAEVDCPWESLDETVARLAREHSA